MFCDKSFKNVLNSLKIVQMGLLVKHKNYRFLIFILGIFLACNNSDAPQNNTNKNKTVKQDSILNVKLNYPEQEIKSFTL